MIIAIDGPAGTGKSTVARKLAKEIGFIYFDTGALYRALTWKILEMEIPYEDEKALAKALESFSFCIRIIEEENHYFIGEKDVTKVIRSQEVTRFVSQIAALQVVREALKPLQSDFAKHQDVIFEGRDLGTVLFPHADLKFFLTADPLVRAQRRFLELIEAFPERTFSYEKILKEIEERDAYDSNRKCAPLKRAEDAILIETSHRSVQEILDQLKKIYLERKDEKA